MESLLAWRAEHQSWTADPDLDDVWVMESYDRSLGARPLQRAIDKHVVTPFARWLSARPGTKGEVALRIEAGCVVVEA